MSSRISLCICTMNRPDDLRKCLGSLKTSVATPHEVIVSDDSREETAPLVRAVVSEFPGVIYLRGPRRGLSANRNTCIRHATGDFISFVDDDVKLHPEFLKRAPEEFERAAAAHRSEKILVTGNQIQSEEVVVPSNLNFLGFYTGKLPEVGNPNAICINSTLFPATLFSAARFDENYKFGSEETDISFHATHLGYRIIYCGELTNYHYPSSINRDLYEKVILQSRIYFGLKRYWIYERSPLNFAIFNVYSFLNAVGHCLKRHRVKDSIVAAGAFLKAWRMFKDNLRDVRNRA